MHFRKASPFGLVSMYRKNRDRHCAYRPVASIGGRSLEPAAIMILSRFVVIEVVAKTINGEVQLQALVDGKKIIITESTVRRDLQLEDAKGVDCLPNATIFEQLSLMGYERVSQKLTYYKAFFSPQWKFLIHTILQCLSPKTTAWNEFSSTMASAIICLATNQKFHISKYIFESMVKNLDNLSSKILMFQDKVDYKELDDSLVRAAIATSSLEVEQDSGGGPRRQETIGDTTARTRFESLSKFSNDPLLVRGNTLRSGEDSLKLNELMELCSNLQTRVSDLEKTKTIQSEEIVILKRRVKKLEQKKRSRTHGLKRLYKVSLTARVESSRDEESLGEDASKQGRINVIDADEDIILINDQDDADMFDVNTLTGDEVLAKPKVVVKDVNLIIHEVTLAQALASLKSVKPKVKANVVEEPSVPVSVSSIKVSVATTTTVATIPTPRKGIVITKLGTSTTTTTISSQPSQAKVQDKGKGIMVEEPMKSMIKKDLVRIDEKIASKLQAEFDEEERLAREKDKANVSLTEEWDDIQAKVDADY
ncbi:hypothetical protein Tco_1039630 [Tanacetum coccineum]